MGLSDRRHVLRLAALAALVPSLAGRGWAHEAGRPSFAPPSVPLRYTRRLVRHLAGGYEMAASRSFAVRIARQSAGGFVVTGEQIAVEVVAPERIAQFAELERRRVEEGLFPVRLDALGRIAGETTMPAAPQLAQAVAEARRLFGQHPTPPGESAEFEAFVQMVHQVGAELASRLPGDLFAPAEHRRVQREVLELPGGEFGEVVIEFTAEADPLTGLMRRATRRIESRIDGSSRTIEEDWTLGPL